MICYMLSSSFLCCVSEQLNINWSAISQSALWKLDWIGAGQLFLRSTRFFGDAMVKQANTPPVTASDGRLDTENSRD
jgi:hypothetical protein